MMKPIVSKLLQKIKKSDFLRSVAFLSTGNILANLLSFLSIPIVSRIYTEQAFGDYAVMVSVASIINGAASLGLTSAIMMPDTERKTREVFMVALIMQISVCTLCFLLALILSPIYEIYELSGFYVISLFLIYIYLLCSGLFSLLAVYVNKLRKNRILFWNALINAMATFCFTIPLGLLGFDGFGFLFAAIAGFTVSNLQMLRHVRPFVKLKGISSFFVICKEYKDFVLYQFPSNLISTFAIQLPNQLFSSYFGNTALGGYAMCERILGVPMRLIGAPITTIYFRQLAQGVKEGKDLGHFTYVLITRILMLAFIPCIVLLFFSEDIFIFILGNSWTSVGAIVSVLVVPYIFTFCTNCVSYCLVVLKKQRVNLYLSIIHLSIIIASIAFGIIYWGDFMATMKCFAVASSCFQLSSLLLIFYFFRGFFYKFLRFVFVYAMLLICFFSML